MRLETGLSDLTCPRAVVSAMRARAMAWTAAERTRQGQPLGSGRECWGGPNTELLPKDLGE
jgi:hypothetical protein